MLEKRPSEMQFSDVKDFCSRLIPECRWLDYKQDFGSSQGQNKQVAKIVSAMANAHGGWILFGVEETKDNQNRGMPGTILGIDASTRPGERIKQICLDAIHPPVIPEVESFPLDTDSTKVVTVVRVWESDRTPHETSDGIFIRTNDISHLAQDGKRAELNDIELLLSRRTKTDEFRERLVDRADRRCALNDEIPQLVITCLPSFPDDAVCTHSELLGIVQSLKVFTAFSDSKAYSAHEGMLLNFQRKFADSHPKTVRAELNVFGLISYKTIIMADGSLQIHKPVKESHAFALLYSVLQSAEYFYRKTKYSGLVDIRYGLHCKPRSSVLASLSANNPEPIEESFIIHERTMAHELSSGKLKEQLYRQFLWSCGYGPDSLTTAEVTRLVSQFDHDPTFGGLKLS